MVVRVQVRNSHNQLLLPLMQVLRVLKKLQNHLHMVVEVLQQLQKLQLMVKEMQMVVRVQVRHSHNQILLPVLQ